MKTFDRIILHHGDKIRKEIINKVNFFIERGVNITEEEMKNEFIDEFDGCNGYEQHYIKTALVKEYNPDE